MVKASAELPAAKESTTRKSTDSSTRKSATNSVSPAPTTITVQPKGGPPGPVTKMSSVSEDSASRQSQPPVVVRGSCTSSLAGDRGSVNAPKEQSQAATAPQSAPNVIFLFPPPTLPALVVSSWLVPTVKRPFKGVPTFVISCIVQGGLLGYLCASVFEQWSELHPCNTPALAQVCAVFVFATSLYNHHSSGTVLQICMYSVQLRLDGEPAPDAIGIMRHEPDRYIQVRTTTVAMRWKLALVPLADMLLELAVFLVGCLFLVTSDSLTELIVNAVALNFISEIDELLLASFFSKASRQRLAKYRFDHRWGVADGDTRLKEQTPTMKRYNSMVSLAPFILLVVTLAIVSLGVVVGIANPQPGVSCSPI